MLLPEAGEDVRRFFFDLLVPHPGVYFTEALEADDVTALGVPVSYVLADDDLALARPVLQFVNDTGRFPRLHEAVKDSAGTVKQGI